MKKPYRCDWCKKKLAEWYASRWGGTGISLCSDCRQSNAQSKMPYRGPWVKILKLGIVQPERYPEFDGESHAYLIDFQDDLVPFVTRTLCGIRAGVGWIDGGETKGGLPTCRNCGRGLAKSR